MNELCLKQCLKLIEQKLGWGSSIDWLNQDFQLLSDQIFEDTRVRLSITTLKRVWGKVNYDSDPSISTLNTLANFIGYANWSAFKQSQGSLKHKPAKRPIKLPKVPVAIVSLIVLTLAILAVAGFDKGERALEISPEQLAKVKFTSQPTAIGLPNSIVFNYDFAGINAAKTTIQQSWNKKMTFEVDKNGAVATGIYYYPGYFKAKLIADGQILKEHDVHVKTNGWMGSIPGAEMPRYLYEEEIVMDESLRLSEETYKDLYALDIEKAKFVDFHYSSDLGEIFGDDFIFETRFKNSYRKSNGKCQTTEVLIHGSEGAFIVPFSIPGCVSDLSIFLLGDVVDGKTNDLSAFGSDFTQWQTLRCEAKGENIQIFVNDKLAHTMKAPRELGRIVGFRYSFLGAGEVDHVKLSRNDEVFYEENFVDWREH